MVRQNPLFTRNLTTAMAFSSAVLACFALGGARAPWSSYTSFVERANDDFFSAIAEVGVLRMRTCGAEPCLVSDTLGSDNCDAIGKTALSFTLIGIFISIAALLVILFAPLKKKFLAISFVAVATLYGTALITWSAGCHDKLESALTGSLAESAISVTDASLEWGIGAGALIGSTIAAVATVVFMLCTPKEK